MKSNWVINSTCLSIILALAACSSAPQPPSASVQTQVQQPKLSAATADLRTLLRTPRTENLLMAVAPSERIKIREILPRPLPQNTERYQKQAEQPVKAVAQEPVSTFSIDVDTGSYANVRRFLNEGQLPPHDAVRAEEIINYFSYAYPLPQGNVPFAVSAETVASPWQPNAELIRIGIQAQDTAKRDLPPANLVFLVDVSGSMNSPDKLPLVKKALRILTNQLRPQDKVTLITYASGEQLDLPSFQRTVKRLICC